MKLTAKFLLFSSGFWFATNAMAVPEVFSAKSSGHCRVAAFEKVREKYGKQIDVFHREFWYEIGSNGITRGCDLFVTTGSTFLGVASWNNGQCTIDLDYPKKSDCRYLGDPDDDFYARLRD